MLISTYIFFLPDQTSLAWEYSKSNPLSDIRKYRIEKKFHLSLVFKELKFRETKAYMWRYFEGRNIRCVQMVVRRMYNFVPNFHCIKRCLQPLIEVRDEPAPNTDLTF